MLSSSSSTGELDHSHLSSFSIRDYAFTYRTKNIQKSWPFSSTSLQLCLKHGLIDPLPPINQPLGFVRPNLVHVEEVSHKRNLEKLGSSHALSETTQGFLACGSKPKVVQVAIVNKHPRKKCGLVVKPGACVNSVPKEDQGSLFSACESMTLRTCPICKAFSSASNTTLNAHIDQCLSVEQLTSKPRTKPRLKVKTLVDIYATAKGCTLEDVDKRNGTKWAVVSSCEVSNKGKKRSVLRVGNEEDAGIGPVYIDAKGQKLRILSEFKEEGFDPSREHEEDVSEKKSSNQGQGKRLMVKIHEYQRGYSEECRGMERLETPGPSRLSRKDNKKGSKICDQLSENGHSLSGEPLVLRGPSHVSIDLSETVSTLKRQNSWRSCGESQVSRKSTKSATLVASPLRCSMYVDKVLASAPKGFLKLKKARFDFSENEDEDSGRWESEMTQECELTDYDDWDDNEETDKVFRSSNPSVSSGEDNDYEGWEETGNNKGDDDMLYQTNDADVEFESMIGGSSFMEVDLIPIPGPPGSFLPSPWDMETDATENHVNSSVITSQVQSSHDQLELTDRNSSESPVSVFAAPETQTSCLHNIITTDKRPSGFRENDIHQSCCCQRKENAFEDTTFGRPAPHMIAQDFDLLSKSVLKTPSSSNPVLRLMGKDLMVVNQREETSHGDSSLKTQHVSPPDHFLHCP